MGTVEQGALARLKHHRIHATPIVESYGARIVGTTGDGVLLEFPSVVADVECAVNPARKPSERSQ